MEEYGVAMGVRRGQCAEQGCDSCPRYQATDESGEAGGPCLNCGHFPALHENLGPDTQENDNFVDDGKIFYEDTDPLGLLQQPGNGESAEEMEARKELQDLCEWSIEGNELRFLELLGSGRSAKVYKGLYKDNEVAIKVLKPILDQKELQNFKGELDIMSSVDSDHVVRFFGGCLQPKICLVMEFCSNGSLYNLLQRKELKFDWPMFFRLSRESIDGVLALHNHVPQIVHRDLKSLNLLVDKDYRVKVCDFGVSRVIQGSQDESTLGKLRGTYAYSAPEVYKGEKYTNKSDVFSLGVIIWEGVARILSGEYQRPYKEFNYRIDFQIIINSAKHGVRPKYALDACPESLRTLITTCWDPSPDVRPDAAGALKQLMAVQSEYEGAKAEWDAKINILAPKPVAPATEPKDTKKPVVEEKKGGTWSHKNIEDFLSTTPAAEEPKGKQKGKRKSLPRSAAKLLESKQTKPDNKKPGDGKLEIEVTTAWKSTVGNWKDEDDFGDDDSKKKKSGMFKKLFGKKK